MTIHSNPAAGLDGVAAAVTALSHVDGEKGELIVAGSRIGELADRTDFEGLVARLWAAATGREADAAEARRRLARGRLAAFERLPAILPATAGMPMVDAFRVAVAAVAPVEGLEAEAAIVGAMPVLAAVTIYRGLKGQFDKHRKIARVTYPIWLYVSVTGVIIYFMLYHMSA